jgi:hypothetical protein
VANPHWVGGLVLRKPYVAGIVDAFLVGAASPQHGADTRVFPSSQVPAIRSTRASVIPADPEIALDLTVFRIRR